MDIERIKWRRQGFREILRSRAVMSDLMHRGQAIAAQSGPGYVASPFTGRNRGRVSVAADTPQAIEDNARRNTLIRNMDAGS